MCEKILNGALCATNLIGRDIGELYKYVDIQDNLLKEQIIIDEEIDVNDISNVTITKFDNFLIFENNQDIELNDSDLPEDHPYFYTVLIDISFNLDPGNITINLFLPSITQETIGSKIKLVLASTLETKPANVNTNINAIGGSQLSFGSSTPQSSYTYLGLIVTEFYATFNNGIFLWLLKL